MATSTQISLREYLDTSYRPDREYIDGEVVEKNMGKFGHGRVQALLTIWFGSYEREWNAICVTEWRTRVSPTRVRIPDLVLVSSGEQPMVLDSAPLLCVEILSPGDTFSDTQRRAADYFQLGAKAVWIIDPETRSGWVGTGAGWVESERLEVPGTAVHVELGALFTKLGSPHS